MNQWRQLDAPTISAMMSTHVACTTTSHQLPRAASIPIILESTILKENTVGHVYFPRELGRRVVDQLDAVSLRTALWMPIGNESRMEHP